MGKQPERVKFVENQVLRTRDLTDDDAYHREMARRHNIGPHEWGAVSGLRLEITFAQGDQGRVQKSVVVHKGAAFDGYGRFLVLAEDKTVDDLDLSLPLNQSGGAFDISLVYGRSPSCVAAGQPRTKSSACNQTVGFTREAELPTVVRTPATGASDRRTDPSLARGETAFGPEQSPPDDPARLWPVFLGTVTFDPVKKEWSTEESRRPYVGLIAERVIAPFVSEVKDTPRPTRTATLDDTNCSTRAATQMVQVGSSTGSTDQYRFAVRFGPLPVAVQLESPLEKNSPDSQSWLGITGEGKVHVNGGELKINGDLTLMNGGPIEFRANPFKPRESEDKDGKATTGATNTSNKSNGTKSNLRATADVELKGWQIYHHQEPPKPLVSATLREALMAVVGAAATVAIPDATALQSDELRVVLPAATSSSPAPRFVIGATGPDGKFAPILTVQDSDGMAVVEVAGNLKVDGYYQGPTPFTGGTVNLHTGQQSSSASAKDDPALKSIVNFWVNRSEADATDVGNIVLTNPKALSGIGTALLADDTKLTSLAKSVLSDQDHGFKIVSPVFITKLPNTDQDADQDLLTKIATGLLGTKRGVPAVSTVLLTNAAQFAGDIAANVLANANGCRAVSEKYSNAPPDTPQNVLRGLTGEILKKDNGPASVAAAMTASTKLGDLVTVTGGILANTTGTNGTDAVASALVANTAAFLKPVTVKVVEDIAHDGLDVVRGVVLDHLPDGDTPAGTAILKTIVNSVIGKKDGSDAVASSLIAADPTGKGDLLSVATAMVKKDAGMTAFAGAVPSGATAADETLRETFAAKLADPTISITKAFGPLTKTLLATEARIALAAPGLPDPGGTAPDKYYLALAGSVTDMALRGLVEGIVCLTTGAMMKHTGWSAVADTLVRDATAADNTLGAAIPAGGDSTMTLAFKLFTEIKGTDTFKVLKDAIGKV